jgi:hypothetical protein
MNMNMNTMMGIGCKIHSHGSYTLTAYAAHKLGWTLSMNEIDELGFRGGRWLCTVRFTGSCTLACMDNRSQIFSFLVPNVYVAITASKSNTQIHAL